MSSRMRPRRRALIYHEEDSDSEEDSRPTRARKRPNYAVDLSSDEENLNHEESEVEIPLPPPKQPQTSSRQMRSSKRRTSPSKPRRYESRKRPKVLGSPFRPNEGLRKEEYSIRAGGIIPQWQSLEHDILRSILEKAADPLFERYLRPSPSIRWLVGMSLLCKSFHGAAISALLSCPPLTNGNGLFSLLKLDQDKLFTNYRMKPRKLIVEAKHSLVQKADRISLPEFVSLTPLLESLRIVSNYDEIQAIWAHPSLAKKTYTYESSLFEALEYSCPRLKEFEWNGRFSGGLSDLIDTITSGHARLGGLTSITLMNMNVPEKASVGEHVSLRERLLAAMNKLPELRCLKISNCDVFGDFAVLESLKTLNLKSLAITACPSLTSSGLETCLETKGAKLEHLRLIGCQSCDGGFLSKLRQRCGSLQTLQINLSFSDVTSWNDNDAHFEDYLPDGPISFPSTLIELELNNLRRIDSAQLEASLASLVETYLPSLRRLSIKAILTSDYRVRARIRREWGHKLEQVFLRKTIPPKSYLQIQKKPTLNGEVVEVDSSTTSTSDESTKRQSTRISKSSRRAGSNAGNEDVKTSNSRNGLCDFVLFRVDDQRPAESQYKEVDFLGKHTLKFLFYQDLEALSALT
jgi:hypothetical protein